LIKRIPTQQQQVTGNGGAGVLQEQRIGGSASLTDRGAEEQRSRGAEVQRCRGAEERVNSDISCHFSLLTFNF